MAKRRSGTCGCGAGSEDTFKPARTGKAPRDQPAVEPIQSGSRENPVALLPQQVGTSLNMHPDNLVQ